MIKQCKGKMLDKVPASKLGSVYYMSTKYDGNYVQIHKNGDVVKFYTSGGKRFYIPAIAEMLIANNQGKSFILEAEYINNRSGKLGDRVFASKLTTYRTEFSHGRKSVINEDEKFMVFDIIITDMAFSERLDKLMQIKFRSGYLEVAKQKLVHYNEIQKLARVAAQEGWEGIILKSPDHLYREGKRVNDAIKVKHRLEAALMCVGVTAGEGKYEGMIGSLVLEDSEGLTVSVGSGLSDDERANFPDYYVGELVEIEYEQKLDTYIQPVFKRVV